MANRIITLTDPFIKRELEGFALSITDNEFVKMPPAHWRKLEFLLEVHVKETTQSIYMSDDIIFGRRRISVEPLVIWLPEAIPDLETRLSWFGFNFPRISNHESN